MRKKVALMTWYKYYNYGTALQAVALYNTIKRLGYDVDVINYSPRKNRNYSCDKVYRSIFKMTLNKMKEVLNPSGISCERIKLFNNFVLDNITETKPCRSYPELHDLNKIYDAFICGSDQIWSPLWFDDKYFLSFVDEPQKMIAYAPSMGNNKADDKNLKKEISKNLKRFSNLSVRENDGKKLINKLTGQMAKVVLDPTLLLLKDDWDSYASKGQTKELQNKAYIICYFLGDSKKYTKYVSMLSQKAGIPYYIIPVKRNQYADSHKISFEIGPAEFISLIKNARYVCTDSFHGMAFSIIYNTPFTAFKRFSDNDCENQNSRLENLLDKLELKDRLIPLNHNYTFDEFYNCDFKNANRLIADLRNESIQYITTALKMSVEYIPDNHYNYKITDNCCGCGACSAICPKGAITVQRNSEGFEHYFINRQICVKCGKCKTVCPMTNVEAAEIHKSYGLYSVENKSEQAIKASSSAGVGYAISKFGVKNRYHICGCVYDRNNAAARHILIHPNEDDKIKMLQGSKYLQSLTADVFKKIIALTSEEKLIFFGTPCQVAAARKLLKDKSMKNIILVDLICHGVPTYYLWEKYLGDINKNHSTGVNPEVLFRIRTKNWHKRFIKIYGNGNTYVQSERKDDFYAFFRRSMCDMSACSECPYREKTSADLRIGDYWGKKFQNNNYPVSMVIANTKSGAELLSLLETENCAFEKQDLEDYWRIQAPYNLKKSLYRTEIISELYKGEKSLHKLRKKYCRYYDMFEFLGFVKAKFDHLK